MEDIRGGLIVNVQNTHAEYREELEGVKFFLNIQVFDNGLDMMVCGYESVSDEQVFEGYCENLYPLPHGFEFPPEDEKMWEELEQQLASHLARNARLTISDEEVRLQIGEKYLSVITNYEVLGGYNEDDAPYMEDDVGLWSLEGDTSYPEDDIGFVP